MKNRIKFSINIKIFLTALSFLTFSLVQLYAQTNTNMAGEEKYPFKAGDGLYIGTLPDTTSFFNQGFTIDDMGYAELPIVGRVNVTRMSREDLTNYVKKNFGQYLRSSNVYVKPMLRGTILGGVANPGLYYFDFNQSLWDVVRRAGGTTLEDGLKEMVWERDRDEVVDDLIPYFQKGVSLKNMGFKSGDQLWTPISNETFWDDIRTDIIPILSFVTTTVIFYFSYQQQVALLRSR